MIYLEIKPVGATAQDICWVSGVGGEKWLVEHVIKNCGENSDTATPIGRLVDIAFTSANGGKQTTQTFMTDYQDTGIFESECCRGRDWRFDPEDFLIDEGNDLYLEDIQWS